MEVRTFELERLDAGEAVALVAPYVFEEREGAPGEMSQTEGLLTVRELPENLDRIEAVLRRYDQEAADVQLRFQIIEADGFSGRDAAIAEVEEELRGLLRYEGYRLVAESVLRVREGQYVEQRVQSLIEGTPGFVLATNVGRVSRSENGDRITLEVQLHDLWNQLLNTSVTVEDEKIMVIGTAAGTPDGTASGGPQTRAYILTVRPVID